MRLDRLYTVNLFEVRRAVMEWLDRAQSKAPEVLITASAINFLALCERFDIKPRRALEVAERVLRDADDRQPNETRALRMYLQHELD